MPGAKSTQRGLTAKDAKDAKGQSRNSQPFAGCKEAQKAENNLTAEKTEISTARTHG
jgi:hypothetical protein